LLHEVIIIVIVYQHVYLAFKL